MKEEKKHQHGRFHLRTGLSVDVTELEGQRFDYAELCIFFFSSFIFFFSFLSFVSLVHVMCVI